MYRGRAHSSDTPGVAVSCRLVESCFPAQACRPARANRSALRSPLSPQTSHETKDRRGRGRLLVRGLSDHHRFRPPSPLLHVWRPTRTGPESLPRDPLPLAPSAALIGRSRITPRRTAARAGPASGAAPNSRLSTQASAGRGTRLMRHAGGRGTRRTHAPLGSTLGSLAVGELRGDSWRFWSPAQRSRRSRWAAGGALAVPPVWFDSLVCTTEPHPSANP